METLHDFLAMGGYAAYVWPAYAVAALLLGGLAIASWRKLRAAERALAMLEQRSRRRGGNGAHP